LASAPPTETQMEEYRAIALRLYNEEFLSISTEEYTQFLASQDPESAAICELYMDFFLWDRDLLKSTRMLCKKLHLKGESQEIDRLLSVFTRAYIKQNPDNVFCTQDFEKIYIILYSLILLNTNLHNAEVGKKLKMSQMDYVANTLSTFMQLDRALTALSPKQRIQIERELHTYYEDLARMQLFLKKSDSAAAKRMLLLSSKRMSVADTVFSEASNSHSEADFEGRSFAAGGLELARLSTAAVFGSMSQLAHSGPELSRQSSTNTLQLAFNERRTLQGKTLLSFTHPRALGGALRSAAHHGFGFTRALALEVPLYRASAASSLRMVTKDSHLSHQSSCASLLTRNSQVSVDHIGDAFSLASFEEPNLHFDSLIEDMEHFDINTFQDRVDLKLELQGAPYLKEGLLKLKILNNDHVDSSLGEYDNASVLEFSTVLRSGSSFVDFFRSFSSKQPKPKSATMGTNGILLKSAEFFVVVSKGELRLYSFDQKIVKKQQKKQPKPVFYSPYEEDVGDGNWIKNAAHVGNYNLCRTVARLEKTPTPSGSRKTSWTLTFTKVSKKQQKQFVFEAGTVEVATEFVNTCNFWASKITAVPPLEESVSSIEYGWTDLEGLQRNVDKFKKLKTLFKWEPLPRGVYFSNYAHDSDASEGHENDGMMKQFLQTLKYFNHLKTLYTQFMRQKATFVKVFRHHAGCSNYTLVFNNYEQKTQEYMSDLTRYKSYIIMLAYGLKLRLDLEEENKNKAFLGNSVAGEPSRDNDNLVKETVVREINKLINTSSEMNRVFANDPNYKVEVYTSHEHPLLVKSPKTYSIVNLTNFDSSPVKQLLAIDAHDKTSDFAQSFSTTTIREEEEPEE
ncbi:hypothetical protein METBISCDRAFT_5728, partial [Metschnikowia bicuspidata]